MASRLKKLQLWKEKMNKNTIKDKIINCVDKLYSKDKYLFDCKVCERCLMFRLAYYLQVEFPKYFVDCEFNKMGFIGNKNQDKIEPNSLGDGLKRMFADIIIHKRNSNTEDNFICLEIKRTKKTKQQQVFDALTRIAKVQFPELIPILGSKEIFNYRNGVEIKNSSFSRGNSQRTIWPP